PFFSGGARARWGGGQGPGDRVVGACIPGTRFLAGVPRGGAVVREPARRGALSAVASPHEAARAGRPWPLTLVQVVAFLTREAPLNPDDLEAPAHLGRIHKRDGARDPVH